MTSTQIIKWRTCPHPLDAPMLIGVCGIPPACSCLSCETFYGAPLAHTSLTITITIRQYPDSPTHISDP
eukprot:4123586-Prymnesium_polylepis.2